jgi:hypothetical protein
VIGIFRLKGFFYVINRLYNIQFSLYIQIYWTCLTIYVLMWNPTTNAFIYSYTWIKLIY